MHVIALVINATHLTSTEAKTLEEIQLLGELWPFNSLTVNNNLDTWSWCGTQADHIVYIVWFK